MGPNAASCQHHCRCITNTFNFMFRFELKKDPEGRPVPPKRVLPVTGA